MTRKIKTKLKILGIAQDGGVPQVNCRCQNCTIARKDSSKRLFVTSILLAHGDSNTLIDATPDLSTQIRPEEFNNIKNIILTHGHVGHIGGLIQFGYEISNKKEIKTYVSQSMKNFLENNDTWRQLVINKNLILKVFEDAKTFKINRLTIQPLKVPHRDEVTDTYGFKIKGEEKTVLYIPDIQSWDSWKKDLAEEVEDVDFAFLCGTFFDNRELPNRNKSKIGHPFIAKTIEKLSNLTKADKAKVYFTHLNHTNPALRKGKEREFIEKQGFNIAKQFKTYNI